MEISLLRIYLNWLWRQAGKCNVWMLMRREDKTNWWFTTTFTPFYCWYILLIRRKTQTQHSFQAIDFFRHQSFTMGLYIFWRSISDDRACVRNLDLWVQYIREPWASKSAGTQIIDLKASKSAGEKGDFPKLCGFVHPRANAFPV